MDNPYEPAPAPPAGEAPGPKVPADRLLSKVFIVLALALIAFFAVDILVSLGGFSSQGKNFYELGKKDHEARRYEAALLNYKRAMTQNPQNPVVLGSMGLAYELENNPDAAIDSYRKAIGQAESLLGYAQGNLGTLLHRRGQIKEAELLYRRVLEINPKDFTANWHLGHLLADRGDFQGALDLYLKAIQANPNSAEVYLRAGEMAERLGRLDEALGHLERAAAVNPNSRRAKDRVLEVKRRIEERRPKPTGATGPTGPVGVRSTGPTAGTGGTGPPPPAGVIQ